MRGARQHRRRSPRQLSEDAARDPARGDDAAAKARAAVDVESAQQGRRNANENEARLANPRTVEPISESPMDRVAKRIRRMLGGWRRTVARPTAEPANNADAR